MALEAVSPWIVFIGSGTRGPFVLSDAGTPWRVRNSDSLTVTRYASVTDETAEGEVLILDLDYTVDNTDVDNVTVTLTADQEVLASTQRLVVERRQDLNGVLDIIEGGDFSSENLASALSILVEYSQDLRASVDRKVVASGLDALAPTIPLKANIAGGKMLAGDDDGNLVPVELSELSPGTVVLGSGWEAMLSQAVNITKVVATYAALTALTADTGRVDGGLYHNLSRTSVALLNDGSQGNWRFKAGASATADGGTILVADDASGYYFREYEGPYQAEWFGVSENSSDNYAAYLAMLTALQAAKGGQIDHRPCRYIFLSNLVWPNDGSGTVYQQAPIHLVGSGHHAEGQGSDLPTKGTIFDFRGTGGDAHITTIGRGSITADNITFRVGADSALPIWLAINTVLKIKNCTGVGYNTGTNCNNDFAVFGGTTAAAGNTVAKGFQGYQPVIEACHMMGIRRLAYGRVWANAVVIKDNFVWFTCGSNLGADGAIIELDGTGGVGVSDFNDGWTVTGNSVEMENYVYFAKCKHAVWNQFYANHCFDLQAGCVAAIWFADSSCYNNVVIPGVWTDVAKPYVKDDSGNLNWVLGSPNLTGFYKYGQLGPNKIKGDLVFQSGGAPQPATDGGSNCGVIGAGWAGVYLATDGLLVAGNNNAWLRHTTDKWNIKGDVLPETTEVYDLGSAAKEFDNIFLQNAATVSDARRKDIISGIGPEQACAFLQAAEPVWFTYKDTIVPEHTVTKTVLKEVVIDETAPGSSRTDGAPREHRRVEMVEVEETETVPEQTIAHKRPHAGFIAQQVKEAMTASGIEDFAGYAYDEEHDTHLLRLMEFTAILWAANKGMLQRIEALEALAGGQRQTAPRLTVTWPDLNALINTGTQLSDDDEMLDTLSTLSDDEVSRWIEKLNEELGLLIPKRGTKDEDQPRENQIERIKTLLAKVGIKRRN